MSDLVTFRAEKLGVQFFACRATSEEHALLMLVREFRRCGSEWPSKEQVDAFLSGGTVSVWGRSMRLDGVKPANRQPEVAG